MTYLLSYSLKQYGIKGSLFLNALSLSASQSTQELLTLVSKVLGCYTFYKKYKQKFSYRRVYSYGIKLFFSSIK